jgi:hypothetical protein
LEVVEEEVESRQGEESGEQLVDMSGCKFLMLPKMK